MSSARVIDIHCHRQCTLGGIEEFGIDHLRQTPLKVGTELTRAINRRQLASLQPKMESAEERLRDMERMGVDVQTVGVPPYQLFHWLRGDSAVQAFRLLNDDLAELVSSHPAHFIGLGAIPLQDIAASLAELRRCASDLSFPGIVMATHIEETEISHPVFEPIWAELEKLRMMAFIHPTGFTETQRFADHYFLNTIGHPLEETICAARLILDGVLERHPNLRIVFAHGGGFLPMYAGRLDHAYHAREDVGRNLPRPPSEYLSRLHFDTVVHDPDQLRYLVSKYGAEHVLLGTDYPYDMGDSKPISLIQRSGISGAEADLIMGGNAERLLGIDS